MKKWNNREFSAVEWVISYISEGSLDERHRKAIRELKETSPSQHDGYTADQKEALIAAIEYFEDFYAHVVKGYPKGNRTVRDIMRRLEYLEGAREKLLGSIKTEKAYV